MTKTISPPITISITAARVQQGGYPAWRSGLPLNQFSPIVGTDRLQGYEWPQPWAVYPGQERRASRIISGYSGLVRVGTRLCSPAAGGHDAWQNVFLALEMAAALPQWLVLNPCSDYVTAGVSISGPGSGPFFPGDGRPVSAQNYWDSFSVSAAKARDGIPRVMRFGDLYPFMAVSNPGAAYGGGNSVKGYRLDTNQWDSQDELAHGRPLGSTWADLPPLLGNPTLQSPPVSMCQHPVTEIVYMMSSSSIHYWLPSTGVASLALDYSPSRGTSKYSGGLAEWETYPSLVDAKRNRLVCALSPSVSPLSVTSLQFVALPSSPTGTYTVSNLALTGAVPPNPIGSGFVCDEDNDRLILVTGEASGYVVYAIDPVSGNSIRLQTIPFVDASNVTAIFSRIAAVPELGGIALVPEYAANVMFMPTI